jgi:hypothetical protein
MKAATMGYLVVKVWVAARALLKRLRGGQPFLKHFGASSAEVQSKLCQTKKYESG